MLIALWTQQPECKFKSTVRSSPKVSFVSCCIKEETQLAPTNCAKYPHIVKGREIKGSSWSLSTWGPWASCSPPPPSVKLYTSSTLEGTLPSSGQMCMVSFPRWNYGAQTWWNLLLRAPAPIKTTLTIIFLLKTSKIKGQVQGIIEEGDFGVLLTMNNKQITHPPVPLPCPLFT